MDRAQYMVSGIITILILAFSFMPLQAHSLTQNPPIWIKPDPVADLAISGDGGLVVISNYTHVKVFSGDGSLLWEYTLIDNGFFATAVDVSRDGNAVVASFFNGTNSQVFFWKNAASLSGTPSPDWWSFVNGSFIGIEGHPFAPFLFYLNTLAISGDGNHVVAGSTSFSGNSTVLYWNNTLSLTGMVSPTWFNSTSFDEFSFISHVDLSFDGNYVVAGLVAVNVGSWLLYFKDATSKSGDVSWDLRIPIGVFLSNITGLALSDDGMYAVLSYFNEADGWSLYYYNFTDTPYRFWETEFEFFPIGGVDISSDGSIVSATLGWFLFGVPGLSVSGLRNSTVGMDKALKLKDYSQIFNPTPGYLFDGDIFTPFIAFYHVPSNVPNESIRKPDVNVTIDNPLGLVSLSCDGSVAIAGSADGRSVYAATSSGELLWMDNSTDYISHRVKISCDGESAATGGIFIDSLHYYRVQPRVAIVGGEAIIDSTSINPVLLASIPAAIAMAAYYILTRRQR